MCSRGNAKDEGSAQHRDLYLATHGIYKRHTPFHPAGFETVIPASEGQETYAFSRVTTGIAHHVATTLNQEEI
jgi:hypothetical protein